VEPDEELGSGKRQAAAGTGRRRRTAPSPMIDHPEEESPRIKETLCDNRRQGRQLETWVLELTMSGRMKILELEETYRLFWAVGGMTPAGWTQARVPVKIE
jgi:hypothetical protein